MRGCDWVTNLGSMGKMSITRDDNVCFCKEKSYEWKDISAAPRDGTELLAWVKTDEYEGYDVVKYMNQEWKWFGKTTNFYEDSNVMGWIPTPKPPKKKHKCIDSQNYAMCVIRQGETDVFSIHRRVLNGSKISEYEFVSDCSFCPFCGQKAGE